MATLTGQRIKDSYKDLLQVSNSNSGIDGTLRTISDGEATESVLQISSSAVNISSAGALEYAGVSITSTGDELNILDGVTSNATELNILDGVTATTAELNILDGVTASAADINLIDGITNGTVIASKAIITDSNKDITGGRNITISGELDAATLDISGDADIDGTLEADAITVNGTALNTVIAGVTVANATLAATTTVSDSTANTNFPVVFHDESNALLDDTGALRYNPSTGTLLVPNLSVAGTTTTVDTVTMEAANAIIFEGATADAHETTLSIVDPTGDRTINLPNVSGTIPVLAAASTTQISATPEELNVLDAVTAGTVTGSLGVVVDSNKDIGTFRNITLSGELDAGSLDISGDADIDGTLEADAITVNGTTLSELISDTAGAMMSSNTESGITVTYQDADNTIDFAVDAAQTGITSLLATDIKIGEDNETKIDFETANEIHYYLNNQQLLSMANASSGNLELTLGVADKNFTIKGTDGASAITPFDIDMAAVGKITFNGAYSFPTSDGSSGQFLKTDGSGTLTFDTPPTAAITAVNNATANELVTIGSTTTELDAEANLTFDGTNLDLPDSKYIRLGTGNDLQIYHNGSNNYIDSATSDQDLYIRVNDGGSTINAIYIDASEVGRVKLPNDNQKLTIGAGDDLALFHDGSNTYVQNTTAGHLIIQNDVNDHDIQLHCDDGSGGTTEYLRIDGSVTRMESFVNLKFGDSKNAVFGASNDLEIYHDGSNSYIQHDGTGDIIIQQDTNDKDIRFKSDDGSGGVTEYFRVDGSSVATIVSKNFAFTDDVKVRFGTDDDLDIYSDNSNSYIDNTNNDLIIRNTANDKDIIFQTDDGSGGTTAYLTLDGSATTIEVAKKMQFPSSHSADKIVMYSGGNEKIGTEANTLLFTADNYKFKDTNGDDNLFMNNSGNVGIGTTSPGANLDVAGSGGSDGAAGSPTIRLSNTVASSDWDTGDVVGTIEYYAHDTSGNAPYVTSFIKSVNETGNGTLPSGALTFGVADYDASGGAAEAMRITEDGNVGIGTTSPKTKLDIENSTAPTLSNDTHAGEAIFLRSGGSAGDGNVQAVLAFGKADGSSRRSGSAIASVQTDSDVDKVGIGFYTSDGSASSQTMDQRMLLDHTGKVGIGTTSPAFGLQIDGAQFSGDAFKITRGTSAFTIINANDSYGVLGMESNDDLHIRTNGNTQMLIDNDGNVSIGNTAPTQKLDMNGKLKMRNTSVPSAEANSAMFFANSGEMRVMDASGNNTLLSPHNFELIPDGASEDMAFAYHSTKSTPEGKLKKVNVDMMKLARLVEQLTGEKLVYIEEEGE